MYVAILLAVGLPVAFKVGKVVDYFRKQPMSPPLAEESVAPSTAQAIITELKKELPPATNSKMLALHTLNVYETINARPPGILGTLGVLTIYGSGLVFTLLFSALLFVGNQRDLLGDGPRLPMHSVQRGSVKSWNGDKATPASGAVNRVVTTFRRQAEANRAFAELTNSLPETAKVTLVGESLILTLPFDDDAARERWFEDMQNRSTNLFVAVSNRPVLLSLQCIAPSTTAATNLFVELEDYLGADMTALLVPPWSKLASDGRFESYRQERHSWVRLNAELAGVWNSPELKPFEAQIENAQKRGAMAEVQQLNQAQDQKRKQLEQAIYQQWRVKAEPQLIDLHAQLHSVEFTNRSDRNRVLGTIAARLGKLPPAEMRATGDDTCAGALYGTVTQKGRIVELRGLGLRDASIDLPQLVDWLYGQGCLGIKYNISEGFFGLDDD